MNTNVNIDFILNNAGRGDVAVQMLNTGWNTALMQQWIGNDGHAYATLKGADGKAKNHRITQNANAVLRKDDWIQLDRAIVTAAQPRLQLVKDIRQAGLTYNLPNGMGKSVLQTERQGSINPAIVSMDPVRESQRDRPEYDLVNLPLPIIHKDFSFSARQIEMSRSGGSPLDTTMAEMCGEEVGKVAEEMALGTYPIYEYAGGFVYGLTNFPDRETIEIDDPTTTGWRPSDLIANILAMRQRAEDNGQYGPYNVYLGKAWGVKLDEDYSDSKGDNTLRDRAGKIERISSIKTLEFLTGYQIILVAMNTKTIREVVGMELTTLQWPTYGGLMLNFKVMAMLVPQVRAEITGKSGIVHGDVTLPT